MNKWHVRNIQIVNIAKKIIIVHAIIWEMGVLGAENFNVQWIIVKDMSVSHMKKNYSR
ncbi:hypothetical protein JYQ78_18300 [Anaerobutyricum hallii]|uniref:hypothetical protein n=1 Tax=Anaerobutyricum hallii TaxID=39488 RepID=UPI001ADD6561|nr:hypothetical protein [Anaerobutyricum hallii]MBP0065120.1 hypothetical protein [Anaerobutyricum hallii]